MTRLIAALVVAGLGTAQARAPAGAAAGSTGAHVHGRAVETRRMRGTREGKGPVRQRLNSSSKVDQRAGSKHEGKTLAGTSMTEEAAIVAGNHADHG